MNAPISVLKGKDVFRWSSACDAAFKQLKDLIAAYVRSNQKRVALDPKEIAHPDARPVHLSRRPTELNEAPKNDHPGKHIFLATDASADGIGGGLFLGENWWTAKPLGVYSKRYHDAQNNYPLHEQEMSVVIEGLKKLSLLVEGQQVTVLTDNKALTATYPNDPSKRMYRWLEKLQDFDVEVKHIEGATNGLADAMSRVSLSPELARVSRTDSGEDCCPILQSLEEVEDPWDEMPPLELIAEDSDDSEEMPPGIPMRSLAAATRSGPTGQTQAAAPCKNKPRGKPKRPSKTEVKAMRVFLDRAPESWAKPEQHQLALYFNHQDDLTKGISEGYKKDPFFSKVFEPDVSSDSSDSENETHTGFAHRYVSLTSGERVKLLYHRHNGVLRLCLPGGLFRERPIREIFLEHVHTVCQP